MTLTTNPLPIDLQCSIAVDILPLTVYNVYNCMQEVSLLILVVTV
mgnify:FL=1